MITIKSLQAQYPKSGPGLSVTGRIPMDYFESNEDEIRRAVRAECFRVFYRGPRISNQGRSRSHTRRCDATHVIISR